MFPRLFRILVALSGICGVAALGYYYSVPFPLPPANATLALITAFVAQYRNAVLFDTWLQAVGALLTVVFFVALVYLANAGSKFSGGMTIVASALTLSIFFQVGQELWVVAAAIMLLLGTGKPSHAAPVQEHTEIVAHPQ
jgi:amino acid transporter